MNELRLRIRAYGSAAMALLRGYVSGQEATRVAWRVLVLIGITLLMSACASTYRPWINSVSASTPAEVRETPSYWAAPGGVNNSPDIYFVVAFSGGGTRAAALAYGILQALRNIQFTWHGERTTLLDQVDVLSGVSGGGITAAYYAAYGRQTFTTFKGDFLLLDFRSDLVSSALEGRNSYRLTSPWFGRGNVLAQQLDQVLFHGLTYGQLKDGKKRPVLFLTATDLSLGASFEFTQGQFQLICSDINAVPLSVAVAASSAVPVVFTPITLKNFAGTCRSQLPPLLAGTQLSEAERNVLHYLHEQDTYRSRLFRPYIHLVDGGLSDNLGLLRIMQDIEMAGGLRSALHHSGVVGVKKIIFLSVNAQHQVTFTADRSDRIPSLSVTVQAIQRGMLAHEAHETYVRFSRAVKRWRNEIRKDTTRGRGPCPARNFFGHEIGVNRRV